MGLFKKKPDPFSERARDLNAKIAALQAEIKRVSQQPSPPPAASPTPPPATPVPAPQPAPPLRSPLPAAAPPPPAASQPRLRSTAVPHGPTINISASDKRAGKESPAPGETPAGEPIFEKLDQEALTTEAEKSPSRPDLSQRLGMRKNGFVAFYERVKAHFRGPATSNPKLVNYLAAGSIQGLRPLRYEKRVARNRFLVLAGALILLLWGIVAILLKHK